MTKDELQKKLDHAENILKLLQTFDYRRALIETRVYFGEVPKGHSSLLEDE